MAQKTLKIIVVLLLFASSMLAQSAQSMLPKCDRVRNDTTGKKDLIDIAKRVFKITVRPTPVRQDKRVYFSFVPVSSSALTGGSGKALMTSTTAAMYLGPHATTNISSATFTPYLNFKGRFGLPLRNSIWLANNTWTVQGDIRFLVYPQYTWGLGSANREEQKTLVDYRYIRFYQDVLKRIRPYLYMGFGYELDYRTHIVSDDASTNLKEFTRYNYGLEGNSSSSGLSLNLIYDSRNNSINPLPGAYANFKYRFSPVFMGSSENWHSVYLDAKKYISLNNCDLQKQNTLAFWSYFWTVLNSKAPYLDLPSTGWDSYNRSARGIDQNRYRGQSLFYFETEYRRDITHNGLLGFVVFTNINTVSGSGTMFTSWHPAAGAGLRIKFNKSSATNICIDYGFSKDYSGIKLALGETF